MEVNQIEAFLAVFAAHGFSRAATILHLSQPAISRRISLLEEELGITLFERIHHGIILTEAGQTFLPFAQRVVSTIRDGVAAVQSLQQHEHGTIDLAIVGTLASTSLTTKLLTFRETYPDVKLRLRTARSNEVSNLVRAGEVHLGLRYFPDSDASLISRNIDQEELVVVCSPHNYLVTAASVTMDDLHALPWITFPVGVGDSGEPFTDLLYRLLAQNNLTDVEIVTIDSLTAQKRLIEADFGVGILPFSSIHEEQKLGSLHILDVPQLHASVPISVVHRRDGYLSKAAVSLLHQLTISSSQ
jgi:DNA-binding transcriptional LysR family regulator